MPWTRFAIALALGLSTLGGYSLAAPPLLGQVQFSGSFASELAVHPKGTVYIAGTFGQNGWVAINAADPTAMTQIPLTAGWGGGVALDLATGNYATTNGGSAYAVFGPDGTLLTSGTLSGCGGHVSSGGGKFAISTQCNDHLAIVDATTGALLANLATNGVGSITAYNSATNTFFQGRTPNFSDRVVDTISVDGTTFAPTPRAIGLVFAANGTTNRLYSFSASSTAIWDGNNYASLGSVPFTGNTIEVDPTLNRFFIGTGSTINVFDGASNTLVDTISLPTGYSLLGMKWGQALKQGGSRLYVAASAPNGSYLLVYDVSGRAAGPTIATVADGLGRPFGVAVYKGFAYLPDPSTHRVWQVDLTTGAKTVVAGTGEQGFNGDGIDALLTQLDNPSAVAVDASGLYIADTGNHVVRRIATPGQPGAIMMTVAGVPTEFAVGESTPPECSATPNGSQCTPANSLRLYGPRGLALDTEGNLYIADRMNQQIKKLYTSGSLNGLIFVVAGLAGYTGANNGPVNGPLVCPTTITTAVVTCSPGARLNSPVGLAVGGNGDVYVATEGSNNIRVVSPSVESPPVVSTLFTGPLLRPTGVAFDGDGNVIIANYGNHTVVQLDCGGDCPNITLAGTPGTPGNDTTHLRGPAGIAVDGTTLYIADTLNGRLVKIALPGPIIIGAVNAWPSTMVQ